MSRIRFEVIPPIAHPEEPVGVCGSLPGLGEWDPRRALELRWDGERHVGSVEADDGTTFEYKILRGDRWEAEAVDAWGHVPWNASHTVWLDATVRATVADWKDRYAGRLTRDRVYSEGLAGWRELLVWLPPGYAREPERRYPVIYFNDGANVFDPVTSPISGVDLAADEWVRRLADDGEMPAAIVVAVLHAEGFREGTHSERDNELSPERAGAAYAGFLAAELVPAIDAHYRTLADPAQRWVVGASLGALNAFYTAVHFPAVFRRMAGLSTTFEDLSASPPTECPAFCGPRAKQALDAGARFYFDYGTEGRDAEYTEYHRVLAAYLAESGGADCEEFRIVRVLHGRHDEASWRLRLGDALRFLAR